MSAFTDWTGGGRPHHPATLVEVRLRDGRTRRASSAFVQWWWGPDPSPGDVVAYREVPPEEDYDALARVAVGRLKAGDDPLLDRIGRMVDGCSGRGQFGAVALGEYPESGRVWVPTIVLADLLSVAKGAAQ